MCKDDPKKLSDSQDNVWLKLSMLLSQSSSSTNSDGLEKFIEEDTARSQMETDPPPEQLSRFPSYNLRSRQIPRTELEETQRRSPTKENSPSDMDTNSQESISMLQDCYEEETSGFPELTETCWNSQLEMMDSEEEVDNGEEKPRLTETETQTDFTMSSPRMLVDEDAENHAKFIGCVVRLKFVLSSKKNISSGDVNDVLRTSKRVKLKEGTSVVPTETINYVLRSANIDRVFEETVEALVLYLEEALQKNLSGVTHHWRNSVYEMSVEMVNQAVDAEPAVRRVVDAFLRRLVESILTTKPKKNITLESKSMFVVNFCQSVYLIYTTIDHIIERLRSLKSNRQLEEHSEDKLTRVRITKSSYFLLRILQSLLVSFKSKLGTQEEVLVKKPEPQKYNVLEMWRKHWKQPEVREEEECGYQLTVSRWCDDLDDVLMYFVNHLPVCSMAVERCGRLAKDILRVCHTEGGLP